MVLFKGGISQLSPIRLLEQGKVAEADKKKDEVEEKQRERRKEMAKKGEEHIPRFFRWGLCFHDLRKKSFIKVCIKNDSSQDGVNFESGSKLRATVDFRFCLCGEINHIWKPFIYVTKRA